MNKGVVAGIIEEGTKIISDVVRYSMARGRNPRRMPEQPPEAPQPANPAPQAVSVDKSDIRQDLDYRWECCVKHLGGASVLLREAFERANDEGIGEGTAEKILETLNEHAGMEADLEKMLDIPDGKETAERVLSGVRQFRASAWKVGLPRGQGTKEDVEAARMWNNILFQETLAAVKRHPGTECVMEGM